MITVIILSIKSPTSTAGRRSGDKYQVSRVK